MEISTRNSDYDPLSHVNSAAYFDYVDTLVARSHGGKTRIAGIQLQYSKEIDRSVNSIAAGLESSSEDNVCRFKIYSAGVIHASGEMRLARVS